MLLVFTALPDLRFKSFPSSTSRTATRGNQATDVARMPEEAFPSSFASKRPVVNVEGVTFYVPGDAMPSHGGAGTEGALEIARLLEDAGICCCMVGISALRYFGAWRVRHVS